MINSLKHICIEDESDEDTQTKASESVNVEQVMIVNSVIITRRCCIDENEKEEETEGARAYVITLWIEDIW
jgi:hypothetical protein